MLTLVGVSLSLPVLSLFRSDSCSSAIVIEMVEPAGMTTRPVASFTSIATLAVTVSPALFDFELIESIMAAAITDPASRVAGPSGAGVGAAESFAAVAVDGLAAGLGLGFRVGAGAGGSGAGAAAAAGASARGLEVSTGASWRSRLMLSVLAAACFGSPPRQAPAARRATAISIVLVMSDPPSAAGASGWVALFPASKTYASARQNQLRFEGHPDRVAGKG